MAGYFFRGNADSVKVPECNTTIDSVPDVRTLLEVLN